MLIATAGHIDHGKTSLVRALTGVETDRLPEEKKRGISIELGFAHWSPVPGQTIGFVDVPGHERFVRTMLAGVSAVQVALLVVAADDGMMPQTVEHLEILDLLGVAQGFVAITKCDRVPAERVAQVQAQVAAALARSTLAGAPMFAVSSVTGQGIAELAGALRLAAQGTPPPPDLGRAFRLAIDRAFTIPGAGTVVTGTALDGMVEVGARLVLSPAGVEVRVRGLQSGGRSLPMVEPQMRCALNLAGLDLAQVHRGNWLVAPESHAPTTRLAARIRLLPGAAGPLPHNSHVVLHHGTTDIPARLLTPGVAALAPGEDGRAVLVLDHPTQVMQGDRLVLRDASGSRTLGGGRVIEPQVPALRRRIPLRVAIWDALEQPGPGAALSALLAIPGHEVDLTGLAQACNLTPPATEELFTTPEAVITGKARRRAVSRSSFTTAGDEVIATLATFHAANPRLPGMPQAQLEAALTAPLSRTLRAALLRDLIETGRILSSAGLLRITSHKAASDNSRVQAWQKLLTAAQGMAGAPFSIPDLAKVLRLPEPRVTELIVEMRGNGDVWRLTENRFLLREQVFALAQKARTLTEAQADAGFTAAEYRDAAGIGRNLAIQILEFYDRTGATRRQGDARWMRDVWQQVLQRAAQMERGLTPRAYLPPPQKRGSGWR